MKEVIGRTCNLRAYLHRKEISDSFEHLDALPQVPWIYAALTKALSNPKTTAAEVAHIIESDKAVAEHLLEFAASPLLGNRTPPRSLTEAMVSLGFKMVKNAALTFSVFHLSEQTTAEFISFEDIHHHALRTAAIAKALPFTKPHAEDLFLAAVLHDIGKWALGCIAPDRCEQTARRAADTVSHMDRYQGTPGDLERRGAGPADTADQGIPERLLEVERLSQVAGGLEHLA